MTIIAPPPSPAVPATLDFAAIKKRQQATWSSGDFSVVAGRMTLVTELLCEAANLQAGDKVLDVAAGSGNAAIAAARRGCLVVASDYVPALLERARLRAQAEHLELSTVEADAENLPFPDASFDAALSAFGAMFAPRHHKAAAELARITRPGGTIGLLTWTPDGFIGQLLHLVGKYIPPAPGLTSPIKWGDPTHLKEIFAPAIRTIETRVRTCIFRFPSAEDNVDFFRRYYGPTLKTFEALPPGAQTDLARDMAQLARLHDKNGGAPGKPVAIAADYLETLITRA